MSIVRKMPALPGAWEMICDQKCVNLFEPGHNSTPRRMPGRLLTVLTVTPGDQELKVERY